MEIVAVINCKGGVSKTTITARRTFVRTVFALICLMFNGTIAEAAQTLIFDIKCVNAYIKQGKPEDDFRTKTGQPIECGDSAVLSLILPVLSGHPVKLL